MIKPVLLLDVDGVIADCSTAVHEFAERLLGRKLHHPDVWHAWEHPEALGLNEEETRLFQHCARASEFPYHIEIYPGADEAVFTLKEHFDVCFVTAAWRDNKHWVHARDALLEPFGCDVVYTHAKHRVAGNFFCDDKVENVLRGAHGTVNILFERSYNKHATGITYRVKSLLELVDYVVQSKNRT